jgi:hypothetical protein
MVSQEGSGMGRARINLVMRGGKSIVLRNWMNFRVSVDLLSQSLTLGESNRHQAFSRTSCTLELRLAKFQPSDQNFRLHELELNLKGQRF